VGTTIHLQQQAWSIVAPDVDKHTRLIGGLEHLLFFHILGRISPTDFHIFQRGRSTTNQPQFEAMSTV